MKTRNKILLGISISLVFFGINTPLFSQTSGSLSFSCSTTAPSGDWGNKHVLAIWIENSENPSAFIKTKAKYGNEDDHLTSWVAKSGKNLVDAVTGSTLSSYATRSVIWDGTNVSSVVVPDGDYKIFIEMGWGKNKTSQHSVFSFTFTKGPNAVQLTPAGNENYSNVVVNWEPLTTLVESDSESAILSVFPNPTSGALNLKISQSIPSASIVVQNALGALVFERKLENGFTGDVNIDLRAYANGLYFVSLRSPSQQYIYKVMLQK